MIRCSSLCLLLTGSLAACSSMTSSNDRAVGVIHPTSTDASVINAPDTVTRHRPFDVVINTFGGTGCFTPQDVTLRVTNHQVVMMPFDLMRDEGACLTDYSPHPHPVRMTLSHAGETVILVRGISIGGTIPGKDLVTVSKTIVVVDPK